jgi:hypothetical protein
MGAVIPLQVEFFLRDQMCIYLLNIRELCKQVVSNRPIIKIKVLFYLFFIHTLW